MKRVHVFISGRVQGVGFRYSTRKRARKHNVEGWVKNLSDGRVEAVFEGSEEDVESMLDFCRKGPMLAKVNEVEVSEEPVEDLDGFEVRY